MSYKSVRLSLVLALVFLVGPSTSSLFATTRPERGLERLWSRVAAVLLPDSDERLRVVRRLLTQPRGPESASKHGCGIDPNGRPIPCP